ncbi:MAG TPA: hypothetical protein VJR06_00750, partial [Nitrososphaerales archaeon]|nr:hypothetical protein [Nitrososphaerales archaeon]
MIIGVPRENAEGERRVSLVPESIQKLKGVSVHVQSGAGEGAGYPDSDYARQGANIVEDAGSLFGGADLIVKIQPPTASEAAGLRAGSAMVSFLYPVAHLDAVGRMMERRVSAFAMELMPRISRAQSMDALSSQSLVAGYKAVLIAAESFPK